MDAAGNGILYGKCSAGETGKEKRTAAVSRLHPLFRPAELSVRSRNGKSEKANKAALRHLCGRQPPPMPALSFLFGLQCFGYAFADTFELVEIG